MSANEIKIDAKRDYSPAEIAEILKADPKTIRRIVRNVIPRESHPGRGGAWKIKGSMIEAIKERMLASGSGRVVRVDESMMQQGE